MEKKIILIGTGNLGKRYIQAISKIEIPYRLIIYDISQESLSSVDDFLLKNSLRLQSLEKKMTFEELLTEIDSNSILINAATAKNRFEALVEIIKKRPYAIIAEKPVTQNLVDYQNLIDLAEEKDVKVFVHLIYRFQPFCKKIKEIVTERENFQYFVSLPRRGLACVGIHQIDLFFWLFDIQDFKIKESILVSTYEQKRKGYQDIYGNITLKTSNNGFGYFINSNVDSLGSVMIILNKRVINLFEDQKILTIVNKDRNDKLEILSVEWDYASSYMARVITGLLEGDKNKYTELVTLKNAYLPHKVIFDYTKYYKLENLNIT